MRDLFFGAGAVVSWACMSMIFLFLATYIWQIVWEVGGIRGTATGIIFTGLAIVTGGFSVLLSHQALVSNAVVGAIVTTTFWPILLASVVLCDLYAADRNNHRAFTTRLYMWYQRARERGGDGKQFTA